MGTNTMTVDNNTVQAYNNLTGRRVSYMNDGVIRQYNMIPLVVAIVIILIIILYIMYLMKVMNIRSLGTSKAVRNVIDNVKLIRKKEKFSKNYYRFLSIAENLIEKTPFKLDQRRAEYLQYNIDRIGLKTYDGSRTFKARQLNGAIQLLGILLYIFAAFIMIFFNGAIGLALLISSFIFANSVLMLYLRMKVAQKDKELKNEFLDLYLKIHNILIEKGKSPLAKVISSYAESSGSDEVKQFADVCTYNFETYGEYVGSDLVSKHYREVNDVVKLMTLIKENQSGAEIQEELVAFRKQLIEEDKFIREKNGQKIVDKMNTAMEVGIMVFLGQICLSAMIPFIVDIAKGF